MVSDEETLFLKTLEDVENRLQSKNSYEVLLISSLLRKLLLNERPLVDQVNSKYREKILFEIIPPNEALLRHASIFVLGDGLYPGTAAPRRAVAKPKQISRSNFLKTVLIKGHGKKHTVKDIILFEANIMGGVHSDIPRKEKQRVLQEINREFMVLDTRSSLVQLKAIARVVVDAMANLRARIC